MRKRKWVEPILVVWLVIFLTILLKSQATIDSQLIDFQQLTEVSEQESLIDSFVDRAMQQYLPDQDTFFILKIQRAVEPQKIFTAKSQYAQYLNSMYQFDEAAAYYKEMLPDTALIGNPLVLGDFYYNYAIHQEDMRDNESARTYLLRSIDAFEKAQDSTHSNYADSWMELGWVASILGKYSESSLASNQAKAIYQANRDSAGISASYVNLSILYSQIGLYEEAFEYYQESKKFLTNPQNKFSKVQECVNFGRNLILQDKWEEAYQLYFAGLQYLPLADDDKIAELFLYNGLIETLYYTGRVEEIANYFAILENIYDELGRTERLAQLYLQSKFFDQLTRQKFYEAERVGMDMMQTAEKGQDASEIMTHARFLSELYKRWAKYDQALVYNEIYVNTKDSIQGANKAHALLLYQTQYETAEKEHQISQLEQERQLLSTQSERDRLLRVVFVIGLVLLSLIGLLVYNRQRMKNLRKVLALRQEISSNLHDELGSRLSGISMQAQSLEFLPQESGPKVIQEIGESARQTVSLMRDLVWSIDSRRDKILDLKDKLAETSHALFGNSNFTSTLTTSGDDLLMKKLNPQTKREIFLIAKEAFHNILKHSNGSEVNIELQVDQRHISLSVHDNGRPQSTETSSGQGIDNMHLRATKISGFCKIHQDRSGYSVVVKVPF